MLDIIQDVPVIPSADLETDPQGTLRRYRASHPFAALETGGYIVLGYEDVSRLARDPRLQATEVALPAQAGLSQGALFDIFAHGMLTANGGVHQARRSPLSRALAGEVAEEYRRHVRRSAHLLIDRCFADGRMELVRDYAAPLPALGLAGLATHRALSLRGFKPTIVDRNPGAGEGGAGLFLPGNSVGIWSSWDCS